MRTRSQGPNLFLAATLLVSMSVWFNCEDSGIGGPSPNQLEKNASEIVDLLRSRNLEEIANTLHYPGSYTAEELARDRKSVEEGLQFLTGEFGAVRDVTRQIAPVNFFEIGVSGGDLEYWKEYVKTGTQKNIEYRVTFSKIGPGILRVTYIKGNGQWEVRSVDFGIEATTPGARETILTIGKNMLAQHEASDPGSMEQAMERALPQNP